MKADFAAKGGYASSQSASRLNLLQAKQADRAPISAPKRSGVQIGYDGSTRAFAPCPPGPQCAPCFDISCPAGFLAALPQHPICMDKAAFSLYKNENPAISVSFFMATGPLLINANLAARPASGRPYGMAGATPLGRDAQEAKQSKRDRLRAMRPGRPAFPIAARLRADPAIRDVDDPAKLSYRFGHNPLYKRINGGTP